MFYGIGYGIKLFNFLSHYIIYPVCKSCFGKLLISILIDIYEGWRLMVACSSSGYLLKSMAAPCCCLSSSFLLFWLRYLHLANSCFGLFPFSKNNGSCFYCLFSLTDGFIFYIQQHDLKTKTRTKC